MTVSPGTGAPMSSPCRVQASGSAKAGVTGGQIADIQRAVGGQSGKPGKTAVAMDADGDVAGAQVDAAPQALVASPTGDVGIAGDPGADRKHHTVTRGNDLAAELVTEGDRWHTGKLALEKVPVRAADARGKDTHQNLAGAGDRDRNLDCLDPSDRLQPHSPHVSPPLLPISWHGRFPLSPGFCAQANTDLRGRAVAAGGPVAYLLGTTEG